MGRRTGNTGERLRTSYWFVPTLMLVGAALLAWATLRVDEAADPEDLPWVGWLVYSGGPEGAHALLGATASSTITVAGVVFSIAIVTLQLASTQFGPRMLANFVKDRGNQVTLGTFVAGFLYSLLVLRDVRSGEDQSVPHLSVTVALLLAVAGLSVLIYFVHLCIVYGSIWNAGLWRFYGESLTPMATVFASLAVVGAMCGLAWQWNP